MRGRACVHLLEIAEEFFHLAQRVQLRRFAGPDSCGVCKFFQFLAQSSELFPDWILSRALFCLAEFRYDRLEAFADWQKRRAP